MPSARGSSPLGYYGRQCRGVALRVKKLALIQQVPLLIDWALLPGSSASWNLKPLYCVGPADSGQGPIESRVLPGEAVLHLGTGTARGLGRAPAVSAPLASAQRFPLELQDGHPARGFPQPPHGQRWAAVPATGPVRSCLLVLVCPDMQDLLREAPLPPPLSVPSSSHWG